MQIYTPQSGNTAPGSQLENLRRVLASITTLPMGNMSTPDVTNAYTAAQGGALDMGSNQQDYVRKITQDLTQQAGIPQLQSQYGDLSKIYDLYLHDGNMAQKYAATGGTGNVSPYANPALLAASGTAGGEMQSGNQADMATVSNMTTPQQPGATIATPSNPIGTIGGSAVPAPNPYLGSTFDIIASTANAPQAPSLTTAETAQPLNAGTNMMDLINSLIGTEQGVVSGQANLTAQNYQSKMDTLQKIADILGGELGARRTAGSAASGTPGTRENAGSIFNQIVDQVQAEKSGKATEQDIWNYINQHDAALRDQGVNVDELWKLHKDLANKVGWNGAITGGTKAAKASTASLQHVKLGDGSLGSYDKNTGKYYDATGQDVSAVEKNRTIASDEALVASAKKMKDALSKSPVIYRAVPGMQHFDPNVAQAQAELFQNITDLKKAIGGRVTQRELFTWLETNFPVGKDINPAVMDAKIKVLQEKVDAAKRAEGETVSSGGTGKTFQIGKYSVQVE